jgi:hypothetical protein
MAEGSEAAASAAAERHRLEGHKQHEGLPGQQTRHRVVDGLARSVAAREDGPRVEQERRVFSRSCVYTVGR